MIELKLDGHTVFQIDVVSQYKDKLRQQDAQRNEHLAEVATLRDERDALKRHNEEQRKALYALELRVGREPHQPLQECKPLTEVVIKWLLEDNNLHFGQYAVRLIRVVEEAHGIKEQP